jgi:ABC-2 type transport system ATP-binding protein
MDIINIKDLEKRYNNITAINIPSLNINQGEIVGIVGNNGAGKTTLFRLCLDLIRATKGFVYLNGFKVSTDGEWKKVTGSYLDTNFLIEFLTAKEFFYFTGDAYGLSKAEIDRRLPVFQKFIGEDLLNDTKFIHELSSGNKQKTGIVSAMITFPEILILDEPFNFLDPSSQIEMKQLLQKFNDSGTTILLSSHNIQYTADICSRIIILERGIIVRDERSATPAIKVELEKYFMNS